MIIDWGRMEVLLGPFGKFIEVVVANHKFFIDRQLGKVRVVFSSGFESTSVKAGLVEVGDVSIGALPGVSEFTVEVMVGS